MKIELRKATNRNTQAQTLDLGPHRLYFSYETTIAYAGPLGRCRIRNSWGPTTGRHFKEMGCYNFLLVEDKALDDILERIGD